MTAGHMPHIEKELWGENLWDKRIKMIVELRFNSRFAINVMQSAPLEKYDCVISELPR